MKDTMHNLTKLPKSTLLPALGLFFFVFVAVAGVYIAQYQQMNRGPVTPNAPGLSQAGGNVCTTSWIAQVPQFSTPTPTPPTSSTPSPTPSPSPSPSPTPTPGVVCEDCNWQVDAIWGPVINDFGKRYVGQTSGPNARYSTNPNGTAQGKRLISAKSDEASPQYPGCQNIVQSGLNQMPPVLSADCANPVQRLNSAGQAYLKMVATQGPNGPVNGIIIDRATGMAKVTIKNNSPNCTYDVGFVSYKANWPLGFEKQVVNDLETVTMGPGQTEYFEVELPMNNDGPQCHSGGTAQCPNYALTAQSFASPLPSHTWWDPTANPLDTDEITYLREFPLNYQVESFLVEEIDVDGDGDVEPYPCPANPAGTNITIDNRSGVLAQNETLTISYPQPGNWGCEDTMGAFEAHTTIHFQYLDGAGQQCAYFGIDWDRWYHPTSANLVVRNNNLVSSGTFSVMSNGTVLRNQDGSAMTFTLSPRTEVTVNAGLPRGATSVQLKSSKGAFQVKDVVIKNNLTGATLFDLSTVGSLKAGATTSYGQ